MAQELERINDSSQHWFDYSEAAELFGITKNGFNKLINRHPDIKDIYVGKTRFYGRGIRRFHISKAGLLVLANVKNNGSKDSKKDTVSQNKKAKQELVGRVPVDRVQQIQL